jgi:hypothetical protein
MTTTWTKEEDNLLMKLLRSFDAENSTKKLMEDFDKWCKDHYESPWLLEYMSLCNL